MAKVIKAAGRALEKAREEEVWGGQEEEEEEEETETGDGDEEEEDGDEEEEAAEGDKEEAEQQLLIEIQAKVANERVRLEQEADRLKQLRAQRDKEEARLGEIKARLKVEADRLERLRTVRDKEEARLGEIKVRCLAFTHSCLPLAEAPATCMQKEIAKAKDGKRRREEDWVVRELESSVAFRNVRSRVEQEPGIASETDKLLVQLYEKAQAGRLRDA
jgi:hypothetical protein